MWTSHAPHVRVHSGNDLHLYYIYLLIVCVDVQVWRSEGNLGESVVSPRNRAKMGLATDLVQAYTVC